MTIYQSTLLRQILDVNWDVQTANVSPASKDALVTRLNELTDELIHEMGEEEYYQFMLNGQEMFASK